MVFANAGIPVLLKESDQAALDRGLATIRSNYANSVKRGRFTQQYAEERLALITPTLSYDAFNEVDIVIEAAFESMELKKEIFGGARARLQVGRDSREQYFHSEHR